MSKSPIVKPSDMPEILNEFLTHDEIRSREFWESFKDRRASSNIPVPDLFDYIQHAIYYNDHNIDVRLGESLVQPEDVKLFQDVARFVFEDFLNEPLSDMTLTQFKAQLTRRLEQLGF